MSYADFKFRFFRAAHRQRPVSNLVLFQQTASTNDVGRRFVEEVVKEGESFSPSFLFAYEQTKGRGRRGNEWSSSAGLGVYATLLWPIEPGGALRTLPMQVGVALAQVLDRHTWRRVRLKWPNDLVVGGKKLGGILIEAVTHHQRGGAIIGFGVNHGHDQAALPMDRSTSMKLECTDLPLLENLMLELASSVVAGLSGSSDESEIVGKYREWSAHSPGDSITFRLGGEVLSGSVSAIDDQGSLLIETDNGLRSVASGEVIESVGEDLSEPESRNLSRTKQGRGT